MGISALGRMSEQAKLQELCGKTYKEQGIWFLNCFWQEFAEPEAELVWNYVAKNAELDLENHETGCGLDEMKAHVFLEKFDETLAVRDMRDKLRSTGAIGQSDRPKLVPLTHYLLYKYNADWKKLVDETRQGDNKEEMERAEQMLQEVLAAFKESEEKAAAARKSHADAQQKEAAAVSRENEAKASESAAKAKEADAKATEAEAVSKENAAREAEAPFKAAQEEVESALAEVHKQESEYQGKIADCQRRSEEGGVVQRNKAKAELAQLQAEDPLPLSRAKITLEAAQKRAEKARAPFAEARAKAEAAMDEASRRVDEAQAYLNEIKNQPGQPYGSIWWVDRELHEQKKYLPTSRGGIAK